MIILLSAFRWDDHQIRLDQDFYLDLCWWREFFHSWDSFSFLLSPQWAPLPEFHISSDAAGASSNVEGRYQKYARIGALTMVPLGCEPTISNIKEACKRFFKAEEMDCDILAGERRPSWTETSQISNWKKALHVRFIERNEESQM